MSKAPNKFIIQTTKNYYANTSCNTSNDSELSQVSEEVIEQILLSTDTSKAAGTDQIPAKRLKDGTEVLAPLLKNIINLSKELSTFPSSVKLLSLKSIFNKGARTDPQIYRPISLLPPVSKIIKKLILIRKKLIYEYQSGFRTNYSTDFCVTHSIDFVLPLRINRCIPA